MEKDEAILASSKSMKVSLGAIASGKAGLSRKRKKLLEKVPKSGNWISLPKDSVSIKDIAFLSAATDNEFALLRGKSEDVLFHGTTWHCSLGEELISRLKMGNLELVAHSHPDVGNIVPSWDDRNFLRYIGQKKSLIISYITGVELEYNSSPYENSK